MRVQECNDKSLEKRVFGKCEVLSKVGGEESSIFTLESGYVQFGDEVTGNTVLEIEPKQTLFFENHIHIHGFYVVMKNMLNEELVGNGGEIVIDLY